MTLLSIDNIEPKEAGSFPPVSHENLPQHPFSLLLVAPKGGGKTNLICNLILKQYKGYFHRIVVCSPTLENDPKWELVKATKNVLAENKKLNKILKGEVRKGKRKWRIVFENNLEQKDDDADKFDGRIDEKDMFSQQSKIFPVIEEQNAMIEFLKDQNYGTKSKFIIDRTLIVLDDQAGLFKMSNSQNPLVNFVLKHRHYSTSVIFVTQAYKAIPKAIRINMNALILFEIPNASELQCIYEEYPDKLTEEEWMRLYWHIIDSKPYAFFYMNNHFGAGKRIFSCFEKRYIVENRTKRDLDAPPIEEAEKKKKKTE